MPLDSSILLGDVLEVLPTLDAESFDACLCDPPYGLGFMGKAWDHGVPGPEVWKLVARALKPGAHALAFGGTRTFHRLTCAIEDAGFEIRDCLSWLYGQGFPKSLDISKAIDKAAGAQREVIGRKVLGGKPAPNRTRAESRRAENGTGWDRPWRQDAAAVLAGEQETAPSTGEAKLWSGYGTALKPAWEPVILAMKPTRGTFAQNALDHGVAGINVDGCRIASGAPNPSIERRKGATNHLDGGKGKAAQHYAEGRLVSRQSAEAFARDRAGEVLGRWPSNVLLDEAAAAALDEMSGETKSTGGANGGKLGVRTYGKFANETLGANAGGLGDSGGASRFFYCAKASRGEREAGLREAGLKEAECRTGLGGEMPTDDDGRERDRFSKRACNHHPTVKPIALCEYLAKLLLPPKRDTPRRILVPFSGSGSEMIGCLAAGWDEVVGIEREAEYVEIAKARLECHERQRLGPLFLAK